MPRTETFTRTFYAYSELGEKAKNTAISAYRNVNTDYDWWDADFEDFKAIGEILGFTIDNIFFSGFSSQGDGACFTGTYEAKPDASERIREYAPLDTVLHKIADALTTLQAEHGNTLSAKITHSGRYCHEYETSFEVTHYGGEKDGDYADDDVEEKVKEYSRDFMRWIYRSLEAQHDYLTSDEAVAESIEDNGYEFTADGKMI